jgi:hypothetical protein
MDLNTMNATIMVAFLGAAALIAVASAIAWAMVQRAQERTKQLRLERQPIVKPVKLDESSAAATPGEANTPSQPWPQYEVKRTTLPREGGED